MEEITTWLSITKQSLKTNLKIHGKNISKMHPLVAHAIGEQKGIIEALERVLEKLKN